MAQKRPRFSVGVMAMCCGFLSLTVVAREAVPAHTEPGGDAPRKYATVHHQMHPGASASLDAQATATTALSPVSPNVVDSKRHRTTRETFPLPRPATNSEEFGTGPPMDRVRRRRMQLPLNKRPSSLVFVPARGRRYGGFEIPTEKRQLTIEQMLEKGDYFVPNRGKKSPTSGELMIKKGKFDVLLGPGAADEYFFPNRGKKEYFVAYEPTASARQQSQILGRGSASLEGKLAGFGLGGEGRHPVESRLRRNLLENLANEHKDTFFSSRGKRIRPAGDEVLLWPAEAYPVEEQAELVQEVLPDGGVEDFSAQQSELDALLWNDAVPLRPLDQPSS